MEDPVIAADGHSYEREAISRWFRTHDTSPKTNMRLQSKQLIPNHGLKSMIAEHDDQLKACTQGVRKRTKFGVDCIPKVSRLDLAKTIFV